MSLSLGAWFVLQRYLDVERYRPALEAQLRETTGLPVSIGALSLVLRPLPVVYVDQIAIGDGDFAIQAQRAVIHVDLGRLMHRTFHATGIDLAALTAVAPTQFSEFRQKVDALRERLAGQDGGAIRLAIDFIEARQSALYVDGTTTPVFTGDLEFHDVLSLTPSGALNGAIVTSKDKLDLEGEVRLVRSADRRGIDSFQGSLNIEGLRLAEVVDKRQLPRVALDLEGTLSGESPRIVGMTLSGQVEPLKTARRLDDVPHGRFSANASWDGAVFRIDDARWDEDGVRLGVEATWSESGTLSISVPKAVLGAATLRPFLASLDRDSFSVTPGANGQVVIDALLMTFSADQGIEVHRGAVDFRGIDVDTEPTKGAAGLLHQLRGHARLAESTIHIDEIAGQGITVTGTVKPDYTARQASVSLAGRLDLSVERLGLMFPVTSIRDARGEAVIDTLTGTFGAGLEGAPPDLVVKGTVKNGELRVATGSFTDDVRGIAGSFGLASGTVTFNGTATSASMGSLSTSGGYALATRTFTGAVTARLPDVVAAFLKHDRARMLVPPILEPYGNSTFSVEMTLPQQRSPGAVGLSRQGEPSLALTVALEERGSRIAFGDMEGSATLPLAALRHTLPNNVTASGTVPITFRRAAREQAFTAASDLTQADIQVGAYLHKRAGAAAGARLAGEASESAWAARQFVVSVEDQAVEGVWRNGRLVFPSLDLDAGRLATLLPEGATASGRITGTGATAPVSVDLHLEGVGITFKPEVSIDSATGNVAYREGRLALQELTVLGANSEGVVNLVRENDVWQGEVRARRLDVNTIDATRKAAAGTSPEAGTPPTSGPGRDKRFTGRIRATAETLIYRRAALTEVRADIVGDGATITLDGLSAKPRSGVATGTVVLSHSDVYPWIAEGAVDLDNVHASLIDELIFVEPREFEGALTGKVTFRVPIPRDDRPINVASAEADVVGKKGSLGRLGIATKVLNVLRATEIFRLRLPSLRDEGLTFDHAVFKLSMKDGVMHVREVELKRPSFAMTAKGTVNFPQDDLRLDISVYPLQSITGVVERVPIVGQAIASIRKMGPMGLKATGSPFDPKVTPEALPAWNREEPVESATPETSGEDPSASGTETQVPATPHASDTPTPPPPEAAPSPDPKKSGQGPVKAVTGAAKRVLKGILGQ